MREAVHGIATLLLLTGCLGIMGMAFHAYLALAQAFHGTSRLERASVVIAGTSHRAPKRAPFVLMPD